MSLVSARVLSSAIAGLLLSGCQNEIPAKDSRPNILLIVADDLGYSDLGAFGGEISTPNLDALANDGLLLTQFHTSSNCSPTRAMLLSGIDHHRAGLGAMAETMALRSPELASNPGYEGYLNFQVAALPELLSDAGYRTYMTGKWHLGLEQETSPFARGFQRTFAMLEGASAHFNDMQVVPGTGREKTLFRKNGELVEIPADFYSTRFYADTMIDYLRRDTDSDQPFFAYLSFTAPHWPLQAPKSSIDSYRGAYDAGYEVIADKRLAKQKELGLVDASIKGAPLSPVSRSWSALSDHEKQRSARLMEIYAAMVSDMDHHIGEVITVLKDLGEYEDTIIFFMSDNGAEGGDPEKVPAMREFVQACCDNSLENLGSETSYVAYGPEWARVSASPGNLYKATMAQGGIQSPAFIHYAGAEFETASYSSFASVLDFVPTVLDLAGIQPPQGAYRGRELHPLLGRSLSPVLNGDYAPIHNEDYVMGWELRNNRAIRRGDWKLVMTQAPLGGGEWRLFNIHDDPSESFDLSDEHPEILTDLIDEWNAYVARNGVVIPRE